MFPGNFKETGFFLNISGYYPAYSLPAKILLVSLEFKQQDNGYYLLHF